MTLYYISHFLQAWLFPPGLNLVLAWVGFLMLSRVRMLGKCLLFFSFFSLWILSTPIFAMLFISGVLNRYPALQLDKIDKQEQSTIIVLGGGSVKNTEYSYPYVTNRYTLYRLRYAAYLHQKTNIPILVSGGQIKDMPSTEAALMSDELERYFKTPATWLEAQSITTRDEAKFVLPILKKNKIKKIYLITDTWHMPRAMYAFNTVLQNMDINIVAAPIGNTKFDFHHVKLLDCLPSQVGLDMSIIAMHEYVGQLAYYVADLVHGLSNRE